MRGRCVNQGRCTKKHVGPDWLMVKKTDPELLEAISIKRL